MSIPLIEAIKSIISSSSSQKGGLNHFYVLPSFFYAYKTHLGSNSEIFGKSTNFFAASDKF